MSRTEPESGLEPPSLVGKPKVRRAYSDTGCRNLSVGSFLPRPNVGSHHLHGVSASGWPLEEIDERRQRVAKLSGARPVALLLKATPKLCRSDSLQILGLGFRV